MEFSRKENAVVKFLLESSERSRTIKKKRKRMGKLLDVTDSLHRRGGRCSKRMGKAPRIHFLLKILKSSNFL